MAHVCVNCGGTQTIEALRAEGYISCCPERRMVPIRPIIDALEPFARAARDADAEEVKDSANAWESGLAMAVTYGDFRRALAALNTSEG